MRNSALACGLGITVALTLSGCSDAGKDYATPSKICDVAIDKSLLEDLLPNGKTLEEVKEKSAHRPAVQFCTVLIDGDTALSTEGVWRAAGFTAETTARQELHNPRSTQNGKFAVWRTGAATVFDCRNPDEVGLRPAKEASRFSVVVEVTNPDSNIGEKAQKFLASYAAAYRKTLPCQK